MAAHQTARLERAGGQPSLCIIVQRAMKSITGYFGGYISKRQKMGQSELRAAVKALPLMKEKLRRKNFKRSSAQLAHVVNRMFTTLESKGILRTAPEEFMLTSLYKPHDPLAAEFFRSSRHEFFFGKQYLALYDSLHGMATKGRARPSRGGLPPSLAATARAEAERG